MNLYKIKPWLLILPALLFLILPAYGLWAAFSESIKDGSDVTLTYYHQLFTSERFLSSLWFSLYTSLTATLASMIIGIFITRSFAHFLTDSLPRLSVWLPMLFPHLVFAYVIILIFSETGWLAQMLTMIGVLESPGEFPILTRDNYGIGIILAYIAKEVPFVILMLFPVYNAIPPAYYDVVKTLGGSRMEQFKTVEWPQISTVVMEIFFILFAFTLTAYEVPAILGTNFPEMVSVLSYDWFYSGSWEDRPLAFAAMVTISLLITLMAFIGYMYVNRKRMRALRGRL
ncbi:ABC transporter permease [Halobacillus andaensis]|uniref:ABC transporter permease n=1 Tax=Halobacillus andaensis TaxID=1176239 RepID=A0A917BAX6_HALAA|nr:ABC transporter permease subunit [Halobacillus andaensis]MBP2006224.1 putative spermidine/putrescine transport system permease protein [Halobacillus andaensis]GGF33397.1 ABC transporter permease [Halobacillus andaensis]